MKELNSTTPSHKSDYDIFRFVINGSGREYWKPCSVGRIEYET